MSNNLHKALNIAVIAHTGQNRKYLNVPYIVHPLNVMLKVKEITDDEDMLCAAIMHDVLEDCNPENINFFKQSIIDSFDRDVYHMVTELTDEYTKEKYPDKNRKERKILEAERWMHCTDKSKAIKLADIIDNSKSIFEFDPQFSITYIQEKKDLLVSLTSGNDILHREAEYIVKEYYGRIFG